MTENLTREQLIEEVKQLRAKNNALITQNARWEPLKACFVQNEKELETELRHLEQWKCSALRLLEDEGTYSIPAKLASNRTIMEHDARMEEVKNIAFELDLDREEVALVKALDDNFLSMLSDRINVVQIKDHNLRRAHAIIAEKIKRKDREIKSLTKTGNTVTTY